MTEIDDESDEPPGELAPLDEESPIVDGEMIDREDLEEVVTEVVERVAYRRFRGPIPPPEAFRHYENVLPGAADRILSMAERQAGHRMSMERRELDAFLRHRSRGQWFGLCIVVIAFVLGFILTMNDKPVVGFATSISALAVLVGAFVVGRLRHPGVEFAPDESETVESEDEAEL